MPWIVSLGSPMKSTTTDISCHKTSYNLRCEDNRDDHETGPAIRESFTAEARARRLRRKRRAARTELQQHPPTIPETQEPETFQPPSNISPSSSDQLPEVDMHQSKARENPPASDIERDEAETVQPPSNSCDTVQVPENEDEMRFENDNGNNYMLVFKDGGDIEFIPGTDPPEPFTLQRYTEVSGFGYSRIYLYLLPIFDEAEPDRLSISDSEDEKDELPAVTWLTKNAISQSSDAKDATDATETIDPWSVVDSDNEDDCLASVIPMQMNGYCIVMFNLISGFAHSEFICLIDRDDVPTSTAAVFDVALLLNNHIGSVLLFSASVVLVIRRSKPWKSYIREMTQQNVDDTMDFEVKFTDSMETVDDKGPKREFLRLLRNDVIRRSGLFQETAKVGAYVLTHNADKLNNHEYYMAGRAFTMSLIFGGDPPTVLSPSIYSYITVGYDKTTPTIDEVPYGPHREILQKVNFTFISVQAYK
ncbi:G2 M phase-specific E3 ubiquitin- ligase-like isoform X2 [Paramuricea clavata]|uniref:G2 M phase-specific E3 ubiquitin- ligase-like isoform X2 n=1 Tax=Paramuricea clavata TaxID=317549 RepID=A0A7D9HLK6_PARCT|nr:G2 M phase-specific E3 ubiquitin- ligase-like isoform X2 [Paramuricea clavata]